MKLQRSSELNKPLPRKNHANWKRCADVIQSDSQLALLTGKALTLHNNKQLRLLLNARPDHRKSEPRLIKGYLAARNPRKPLHQRQRHLSSHHHKPTLPKDPPRNNDECPSLGRQNLRPR